MSQRSLRDTGAASDRAEPALGDQRAHPQAWARHQAPSRGRDPQKGILGAFCSQANGPGKSLVKTKLSLREGLLKIAAATVFGLY